MDKFAFPSNDCSKVLEYLFRNHHQQLKSFLPERVSDSVLENCFHQEAASTLLPNLAYGGVSIVIAAVVIIMAIYQNDEASRQSMEAQFENDDLKMLLETEVAPTLQLIEKMLDYDAETEYEKFCSTAEKMLSALINSLQNIRKNIIEKKLMKSARKQGSNMVQWLSNAVYVAGVGAILFALCTFTVFVPDPALIVGVIAVVGGVIGYIMSGNSKLTHQEAIKLLEQARDEAREAEEKLRKARFNIYKIYIAHANEQSSTDSLGEKEKI